MTTLHVTPGQLTTSLPRADGLIARLSRLIGAIADWVLGPAIPDAKPASRVGTFLLANPCFGGDISADLWALLIEEEAFKSKQQKSAEERHV